MHRYLRAEAERLSMRATLVRGWAEQLPLEDESMDVVVSTHVLCTVSDPERALREILRVLAPGGRFLFIEHVAAPAGTRLRRWQERLCPFWKLIAGGCHPDRETDRSISRAGFERVFLQRLSLPFPVVAPHIVGVAIK
jgi:ubiquinone/menaquinone biosynthesis C-methylase UbiE